MPLSSAKLLGYAKLVQQSCTYLNALSGTGVSMHTSEAQPIDSVREKDKARSGDSTPQFVTEETLRFLTRWQDQEADESRLIVAPFGFGKSGKLVQFAAQMAKNMERILVRTGNPDDDELRIPFPVRLRSLNSRLENPETIGKWLDFLQASQDEWTNSEVGRLTREEIVELFESSTSLGRRLVCLYDGVDELSHTYRGIVDRIVQLHAGKAGFVLTSRERVSGFSAKATIELQPLSESVVTQMIDKALTSGTPRHRAAMDKFHQLQPAIAELVRRPLFLATWIDAARTSSPDDGSALPATLSQLMKRLALQCFSRVQRTHPEICPGSAAERDERLIPLGWALLADAEAMFDGVGRSPADAAELINLRIPPDIRPPKADLFQLRTLAHAMGLGQVDATGRFFASKIPVVEFLVGHYLAIVAKADVTHQRAFVELVRRWCYRPQSYDTLDFTWRVLSEKPTPSTQDLIVNLVNWMANASDHEPWRAQQNGRLTESPVADCLIRPAAFFASHVIAQTSLTADDSATAIIRSLLMADHQRQLRRQQEQQQLQQQQYDGHSDVARARTASSAIFKLLSKRCEAASGEEKHDWAMTIQAVSGRATNRTDAAVIGRLIDCHAAASGSLKEVWALAIYAATERVPETAAEAVINKLLSFFANARGIAEKEARDAAIQATAGRVRANGNLIRILKGLLEHGLFDLAFHLAGHHRAAIMAALAPDEAASQEGSLHLVWAELKLEPMLLSDPRLVLDANLSVPPRLIRNLGIAPPCTELEIRILAAYRKVADRAATNSGTNRSEGGWSTWSELDPSHFHCGNKISEDSRQDAFQRLEEDGLLESRNRGSLKEHIITQAGVNALQIDIIESHGGTAQESIRFREGVDATLSQVDHANLGHPRIGDAIVMKRRLADQSEVAPRSIAIRRGKHNLAELQVRLERWVERHGFLWPQKLLAIYFRCPENSLSVIVKKSRLLRAARDEQKHIRGVSGRRYQNIDGAILDGAKDLKAYDPKEQAELNEAFESITEFSRDEIVSELCSHAPTRTMSNDARKLVEESTTDDLRKTLAWQRVNSREA